MKSKDVEVLIVDDDKVVSLMHKSILRKFNLVQPVLCENGREAFNFLEKKENDKIIFLIFLDINMPEINGWEFLELCGKKSYSQNIFVIIVTSSTYKADYKRALEYKQVIGFCKKPLTEEGIKSIKQPEVLKRCGVHLE